jgi:hypothetical protein
MALLFPSVIIIFYVDGLWQIILPQFLCFMLVRWLVIFSVIMGTDVYVIVI